MTPDEFMQLMRLADFEKVREYITELHNNSKINAASLEFWVLLQGMFSDCKRTPPPDAH